MNKAITVQYAFKKDGKGERHGTSAERLLATQARKNNALPVNPRPGFGYQGQFAGILAQPQGQGQPPPPSSAAPAAGGSTPGGIPPQIPGAPSMPPPPPPPQNMPVYNGASGYMSAPPAPPAGFAPQPGMIPGMPTAGMMPPPPPPMGMMPPGMAPPPPPPGFPPMGR